MNKEGLEILLIDDSPEDRQVYQRLLKKDTTCEYVTFEAESGEEGLKMLRPEEVDCILLDYNLPDMDGLEFLNEISGDKNLMQIPIIFLTGQGNEMVAVQAMKSGATDYLIKSNLTRDLLARTIQYAIEKRNADRALQEHLSFLGTLIDTIPNPIFYIDTEGRYSGCNKCFEDFFGLSKKYIIGKTVFEIAPKKLAERYHDEDQELLNNPGVMTYEASIRDVAGRPHNVIIYKAAYTNIEGDVKGLVGLMVDITKRKQMEDELRRTTLDLRRNVKELKRANRRIIEQQRAVIEEERLKVLLQMAGATAHEMNQPLTALLGNLQLMDMNKGDPEKLAEHLNLVEEAGQRIAGIVQKIQTIRHDEIKPYAGNSMIVNFDQDINILSVEDEEDDFNKIKSLLQNQSHIKLTRAKDIAEAFEIIDKGTLDLIFLDYVLPSGSGADFLMMMGKREIDIPVVIITGHGDEIIASQVIQAGAYDYLPKANISGKSLSRVITNSMEKFSLKKEVKMAMEKMAEMSTRDDLTGLFNRRYLMEVLEREGAAAERYNKELVLCILDLDHFKKINDTFGHPAGDAVLKEVSGLLKDNVRKSDVPCRFGGEEFAVVMPNTHLKAGEKICERLREAIAADPIKYKSSNIHVTASIGLSQFSQSSDRSYSDLLKKADDALYRAKNEGRNQVIANIGHLA